MIPRIPAILETRVVRLADAAPPGLRRTSPVGRSITRAGASGDEGEVKVYESLATLTLISR